MDIAKRVAKMRLNYHANMLSVNNVLNQLHIRDDEKAERIGAKHALASFDAMAHMGLPIEKVLNKEEV